MRDLRAYNLTLNEAVDLAQNCPLWRQMSTYGATHSYWCMPEKKKKNAQSLSSAKTISLIFVFNIYVMYLYAMYLSCICCLVLQLSFISQSFKKRMHYEMTKTRRNIQGQLIIKPTAGMINRPSWRESTVANSLSWWQPASRSRSSARCHCWRSSDQTSDGTPSLDCCSLLSASQHSNPAHGNHTTVSVNDWCISSDLHDSHVQQANFISWSTVSGMNNDLWV